MWPAESVLFLSSPLQTAKQNLPCSLFTNRFPQAAHAHSWAAEKTMWQCVGWCVHLSPLVSLCFPHIMAHVSLRWKVCSPSRGLVSPLSPHITPYMCACVGWCDCPRKVLPPLSQCFPMPPIAFMVPHCSHCLPTCVPVMVGPS